MKQRYFKSMGEKRKFFNNVRYFGGTRNIAITGLGLMPALGILGAVIVAVIVLAGLFGGSHPVETASAVKHHGGLLTAMGMLAFGAVAVLDPRTLIQEKVNLAKENRALIDAAEKDNRDLTAEEDAKYKANLEKMKSLTTRIERIQEQREVEATTQRTEALPANNPGNVRAGDFGASAEVLDKPKFKTFGEQLLAVARFRQTGGINRDPRLIAEGSPEALATIVDGFMATGMTEQQAYKAAAGLNESVPAEGGFLVQGDLAAGLLQRTYETGEILSLMPNPIEISSPANRVSVNGIDEQSRANGSRFGGVQAFWSNEAGTLSATKPKFRRIELVLNKLIALCYATDEMVADAAVMESIINTVFPLEFSFRIEDALFNGTGNGQPLGFLNSPALVVVAKESGQAASTVVAANVMKMWGRCWGRSRRNAVWCIDQSIEQQMYQFTITSTGVSVPIYLPNNSLSGSPYGTLFGRPVVPTEYNAALTNQGDITLVDFSQMAFARKSVLQAASSMHVNFLTDEMAYRFTMRLDAQPSWNTALTPKNAGPTLSPYVTLAAR
ncbi:MAG TPA: phage major capsid protein [Candidatus Angelobacter sp.]|nr:phage major capsid protein [Candidatus Angelobacter sp.]